MGAAGADGCVGSGRELPPDGNRVITSHGLQGQLMACPPWPGACQPLPGSQGSAKAQADWRARPRQGTEGGHRLQGDWGRRVPPAAAVPAPRQAPAPDKSPRKGNWGGNLEAGTSGGHGCGDLRRELELEHLVRSQVTTVTSTRFSASWPPYLKTGLKGLAPVSARHNIGACLADEKLSPEADVTLGSHVTWEQQS